MANLQQLDIVKPHEIEETITNLMTKGLLGGAPTPVDGIAADPSVLEHGASAASSTIDGLSTHAMSHGATIISGPSEGGSFLERPVGSFLAEQATEQSIALEQFPGEYGPTYLAKRIAGAGEMEIAGMEVNLIDFVPGGDFVQMAAGEKFNPSSMMLALAKGRMEAEVIHGHLLHRETDRERAERQADQASKPTIGDDTPNSTPGEASHGDASPWGSSPSRSADPHTDPEGEGQTLDARDEKGRPVRRNGREIDGDTAARDLAILSGEHARNLDNAVSQWDEHDVHTEMMLHGRKIEIDTHFDAHNADNRKERETAVEHAKHIPDADNKETVTEGSRMAFRSQVHAHLEAASRDEGISR